MKLENVMLSEVGQHQKTNTARFYLHEVFEVVTFIENRMMISRDYEEEERGFV